MCFVQVQSFLNGSISFCTPSFVTTNISTASPVYISLSPAAEKAILMTSFALSKERLVTAICHDMGKKEFEKSTTK